VVDPSPVAVDPTPAPVVDPSPVAVDPTPAPVVDPSPVAVDPTPAPVVDPTPVAVDPTPVAVDPTPAPVVDPTPVAVDPAPPVLPVVDPTPAPVVDPVTDVSAPAAAVPTDTPAATDTPVAAPTPASAPPPLLALPPTTTNVAGPQLPTPTPADRAIATLGTLLHQTGAFESVLGVFFVSTSPVGGPMMFLPGSPLGTPFAVGGNAWRMLLYAVTGTDVAGGFVFVVGPVAGRGRLAACRAGSLVVVFGRLLSRTRVVCLEELTRPGFLRHRLISRHLMTRLNVAVRLLGTHSTVPARSAVLAAASLSSGHTHRASVRPEGAPPPASGPTLSHLPSSNAPTRAPAPEPAPSPTGGHNGSRSLESGILAAFASLAALMFAGFVRQRQWPPLAPRAQLLASPG
jgi:hypothetical protein